MEMLRPELESLFAVERPRPLKRVEYEHLARQGFFDDEKVELLFGMVVPMSPIDQSHVVSNHLVRDLLARQLGDRAIAYIGAPFAATDDSEPEPDVLVVPPVVDWKHHAERAFLVVEVSRSSRRKDRGPKAVLYSISQVDEYWIVDHVEGVVEVYRDRQDGRWASITTHVRGETLSMLAFPDITIAVADILPPPDLDGPV